MADTVNQELSSPWAQDRDVGVVSFDIETAAEAPKEKESEEDYRIGVTCIGAYIVTDTEAEAKVWHGSVQWTEDMSFAPKMSGEGIGNFVTWLSEAHEAGFDILSVNGMGFDFQVLHAEVDDLTVKRMIRKLAWDSIDPAFQFLCHNGFMVGVKAFAVGQGVEGKTEGMDGLKAVEYWGQGRKWQDKVLEYVKQDARSPYLAYAKMVETGMMNWATKNSGYRKVNQYRPHWRLMGAHVTPDGESFLTESSILHPRVFLEGKREEAEKLLSQWPHRLLTCAEAVEHIEMEPPSWFTDPWDVTKFYRWALDDFKEDMRREAANLELANRGIG